MPRIPCSQHHHLGGAIACQGQGWKAGLIRHLQASEQNSRSDQCASAVECRDWARQQHNACCPQCRSEVRHGPCRTSTAPADGSRQPYPVAAVLPLCLIHAARLLQGKGQLQGLVQGILVITIGGRWRRCHVFGARSPPAKRGA